MMKIILIVLAIVGVCEVGAQSEIDSDAKIAEASAFLNQRKHFAMNYHAAAAVEPSVLLGLSRFYKVGDRWVVATSHMSHGSVRMAGAEDTMRDRVLDVVYHEFRVVAVDREATIEVRGSDKNGKPLESSRVSRLVLKMGSRLNLISKQYFYRDSNIPVVSDFDGSQNMPMGFDSFPVELPDFSRSKLSYSGNLIRFESVDLFQRPIQVSWKRGDLWPAAIESAVGRITLVKQEKI